MKRIENCDLKSCSLCRGCSKEWLPALDQKRETFAFEKGERLFNEDDIVKGIFFINEGAAKVHKKWGDDKELIVRIAAAGEIIGHRGWNDEFIYPVSATALDNVTACYIDLEFFFSTLKINHDYAFNLLNFLAKELQESEKRMQNLAHMPVKGRIVNCLLRLVEKFGVTDKNVLRLNISRQDIASYTGTTYETAFRTMSDLIEAGVIKFSGKQIVIRDKKALEELK